jgi:filamentous hemagglutinin family protein
MNKIYKVIWSHARKCYVVVSEIAKNRGKNNTKSIVSQLAARINTATLRSAGAVNSAFAAGGQPVAYPRTAVRWIAPLVLAGILLQPVSGFASTITDKNGNNLIRRGNVQNLYVQTMLDNNNIGLNRFGEYKISAGDIANMHFNEQNGKVYANNLVNLVNSKIDINGTVNAVKNGKIDGNLYFISPDGMTVGPTGVINAGRVGVFIPNTSYWDELWKEDVNVKNNFADFENYGRRDENGQYKETRLAFADGKKIEIYGKINTRNGIVLGAQEILIKEGASLKRSASTADINFNDLVNIKDAAGTVTLSAGLDGELNAAVDGSTGDIILRAKSAHSYVNSFIPKETLESILHTDIQSKVEIGGSVNSDGPVDISALSKTSFTNLASGGTSMLSDIGFNFLNDLGINMTASWVDKTNTATVALTDKGSIQAGGNVNLQTDAALDLRLKADVVKEKGQGTTTAIPVIAVGVMKLANSAVTDVKGGLQSNGNIRLAANADTTANLMANAVQNTLDNDPANSIYTGVAILTCNGLA